MKQLIAALFLFIPMTSFCQVNDSQKKDSIDIVSLFKVMPDSVMPYLTENNALDMVDFMEAKMTAKVTNKLDCESEMVRLGQDTISIRMSESMTVDMFLLPVPEPIDSCNEVICVLKTYIIDERHTERVACFYSVAWRPLELLPQYKHLNNSTIGRRDEKLIRED